MKIFKTISLYYKLGYVVFNCVKHSWHIEIITRSKKLANKAIIRIDDTDKEYSNALYNFEYKPIVFEEGVSFKQVLNKTFHKIKTYLNEDKK